MVIPRGSTAKSCEPHSLVLTDHQVAATTAAASMVKVAPPKAISAAGEPKVNRFWNKCRDTAMPTVRVDALMSSSCAMSSVRVLGKVLVGRAKRYASAARQG